MGVGVSDWRLARAVSRTGQLGVVSGTGIDTVLVRRLQDGDPGGRDAARHGRLSDPGSCRRCCDALLHRPRAGPRASPTRCYRCTATWRTGRARRSRCLRRSSRCTSPRQGHDGLVGINLLTKVQRPNLATLYGAMLAGVDGVLMGAGIPREIPAVLDGVRRPPAGVAAIRTGGARRTTSCRPRARPRRVLGHAAAAACAADVHRRSSPATRWRRCSCAKAVAGVDGLVIEGPTAGGHNAPPRGEPAVQRARRAARTASATRWTSPGSASWALPFWLAGGPDRPERLRAARAAGAAGIQVGTLFAFCDESGLRRAAQALVLAPASRAARWTCFTDPRASPTGYPFKVVDWAGSPAAESARTRLRPRVPPRRLHAAGRQGRIPLRQRTRGRLS